MRAGASIRRVGAVILLYIVPVVAPLLVWNAWKDHVGPTLTGDEPHYLVMADSLVHDGDFDVTNNYADAWCLMLAALAIAVWRFGR